MPGIDAQSAAVRRLVVKLLLELVDESEAPGSALAEIRDEGVDIAMAVLADVAELAATSLVQLHGVADAQATLHRLIVADLEEEATSFDT
ncbi:Uncharacterised protein [Mycolicibacterium aurum]|uniref:Uncharacterized protein n=1 Tax=Mycolicibacterium aurum TaxID=1791 RepID=A0A448IIS5_MYCAU|nr:hypothetical protein [Mycolicibacterium aurum]VEG52359.1 Uncharacterised protein [Mycolicibacterium aurum]